MTRAESIAQYRERVAEIRAESDQRRAIREARRTGLLEDPLEQVIDNDVSRMVGAEGMEHSAPEVPSEP